MASAAGLDLAAQPLGDPRQLARRLVAAVAQVGGLDLGGRHLLRDRAQPGLKLGLGLEHARSSSATSSPLPCPSICGLDRAGALAGRVAGVRDRLAQPAQRAHQLFPLVILDRSVSWRPASSAPSTRRASVAARRRPRGPRPPGRPGLPIGAEGLAVGAGGIGEGRADPLQPGSTLLARSRCLGRPRRGRPAPRGGGRESAASCVRLEPSASARTVSRSWAARIAVSLPTPRCARGPAWRAFPRPRPRRALTAESSASTSSRAVLAFAAAASADDEPRCGGLPSSAARSTARSSSASRSILAWMSAA